MMTISTVGYGDISWSDGCLHGLPEIQAIRFESYGKYLKGEITEEQRDNKIQNACNNLLII